MKIWALRSGAGEIVVSSAAPSPNTAATTAEAQSNDKEGEGQGMAGYGRVRSSKSEQKRQSFLSFCQADAEHSQFICFCCEAAAPSIAIIEEDKEDGQAITICLTLLFLKSIIDNY